MANKAIPTDRESSIPLHELAPGKRGVVVAVDSESDDSKRLMAMGVCTGQTIKLEQSGDPMILKVMRSQIGVSKRLGKKVKVIPCEEDKPSSPKESEK